MTSITLSWASAPRSACPSRPPARPLVGTVVDDVPRVTTGRGRHRDATTFGINVLHVATGRRPARGGGRGGPLPGFKGADHRPRPRDPGGPASRRGPSRTVQGLLGPVAGVLHIRKGRPCRRIPCFPHDSATLPRTSVFSGRSPMCRADPSAHGRISTVLNAGTFPHDSADPPPAGLGRMCSTSPTGPMPHVRPVRHQPDTASTTPIPHSPYRAVAPIPGPAPRFLVRKAH